uniref:GTP-binding protein n=1 Tax=Pan paniscus TaxID=9597 RepID=A0A2R9AR14_PANPA
SSLCNILSPEGGGRVGGPTERRHGYGARGEVSALFLRPLAAETGEGPQIHLTCPIQPRMIMINVLLVLLLGAPGVGKSALARIFGGVEDGPEAEAAGHTYDRSIVVDGEEASLMVYDIWEQDGGRWLPSHCMAMGDAYVIVYSVTDKGSFEKASELRVQLRRARQTDDVPIILVGNKSDLVRSREVSVDEGRACAVVFDCKFIETSAALHHNVQALFEGVVRQIRLRRDSKEANARRQAGTRRRESLGKKAKRFLGRIVARNSRKMAFRAKSKSCHDLSVL